MRSARSREKNYEGDWRKTWQAAFSNVPWKTRQKAAGHIWELQEPGTVPLPEFIVGQIKGTHRIETGFFFEGKISIYKEKFIIETDYGLGVLATLLGMPQARIKKLYEKGFAPSGREAQELLKRLASPEGPKLAKQLERPTFTKAVYKRRKMVDVDEMEID